MTTIPPSESDLLLRSWGFDLVEEYCAIAQEIPDSSHPILELATGTGRMCAVLAGHFPSVISGDISLNDLPRVLQRVPTQYRDRLHFLQLEMEKLPFREEGIPMLVCMNTLHETEHPGRCLDEMIRILHPGGTAIIGDFNETGFATMQRIHERVYHNNHERGSISSETIRTILSGHFRSVRTIDTPLNTTFIASRKQFLPK